MRIRAQRPEVTLVAVLFIEVFRLLLVLFGAVAGFVAGRHVDSSPGPIIGMVLGALIAYVLGGVIGRFVDRERERSMSRFLKIPPGELFAGTLTAVAGMLLGLAIDIPIIALWRSPPAYPLAALLTWLLGSIGFSLGAAKGRQVVAAAGLSRILAPPTEPPAGYALLVDASAVMDRSLMVLGRSGLLVGGVVVPRFVVDQVHAIAQSPDPAGSRRARRGLEALEALREMGVAVHVAENELPEINNLDDRLLEISRRLGLRLATCSKPLYERAVARGLPATELRRIAADLAPDFAPGEKLVIDLIRQGNQPRQAVGFLPDGDMVVVNDAAHAVGREDVVVEVQSTRVTNQGLLVFARLAQPPLRDSVTDDDGEERVPPPAGPGRNAAHHPPPPPAAAGPDEAKPPRRLSSL